MAEAKTTRYSPKRSPDRAGGAAIGRFSPFLPYKGTLSSRVFLFVLSFSFPPLFFLPFATQLTSRSFVLTSTCARLASSEVCQFGRASFCYSSISDELQKSGVFYRCLPQTAEWLHFYIYHSTFSLLAPVAPTGRQGLDVLDWTSYYYPYPAGTMIVDGAFATSSLTSRPGQRTQLSGTSAATAPTLAHGQARPLGSGPGHGPRAHFVVWSDSYRMMFLCLVGEYNPRTRCLFGVCSANRPFA